MNLRKRATEPTPDPLSALPPPAPPTLTILDADGLRRQEQALSEDLASAIRSRSLENVERLLIRRQALRLFSRSHVLVAAETAQRFQDINDKLNAAISQRQEEIAAEKKRMAANVPIGHSVSGRFGASAALTAESAMLDSLQQGMSAFASGPRLLLPASEALISALCREDSVAEARAVRKYEEAIGICSTGTQRAQVALDKLAREGEAREAAAMAERSAPIKALREQYEQV